MLFAFSNGGSDRGEKPSNQIPRISNVSPANETLISDGEPIALSVDASDVDGQIVKVEFVINGSVVGQSLLRHTNLNGHQLKVATTLFQPSLVTTKVLQACEVLLLSSCRLFMNRRCGLRNGTEIF